jgi:uncharacterized protein (TIGR03382 family)
MKALLALLLVAPAALARADWPADASVDVPVANVDTSEFPSAVADGLGGVYVIFSHADSASSVTLRAEHFSASGDRLWSVATPDGGFVGLDLLGLSLGTGNGGKAMAVTDLAGGFVVAYTSGGTSGPWTIDFQRFNADAGPEWSATGAFGGVELLASLDYYSSFYIVPDSLGGALTVYDVSSGFVGQRVDATGAADYGASGFLFSDSQYPGPFYPTNFISPDGQGGMYFIWPNSGSEASDPLITYLTPTGAVGFQVDGAIPATAPFEQWSIAGRADGGGAWATWWGTQGSGDAVYLQQFLTDAGTAFDAGSLPGLVLATGPNNALQGPALLDDGNGGVVAVWYGAPTGTGALYAQRFGPNATPLWGANPIAISGGASVPADPDSYLSTFRLLAAPSGNPTIVWVGTPSGLFAQQLDLATGALLWGPLTGGLEVSTLYDPAYIDVAFGSDGSTYVAFQSPTNDVYVKRIEPDGTLGGSSPDAGMDAGIDAGSTEDAGTTPDAGMDAGSTEDAGTTPDAGMDAGATEDAGPTPDAGMDAGTTPDAGMDAGSDAGNPTGDAGSTPDAGVTPDAGSTPDGGTATASSGCGCSSSAGGPWAFGALLLSAVLRRRRR